MTTWRPDREQQTPPAYRKGVLVKVILQRVTIFLIQNVGHGRGIVAAKTHAGTGQVTVTPDADAL